jgi:hypothetical protein
MAKKRNKRTINITKKQLCEIDQYVPVPKNGNVHDALIKAKAEANGEGIASKVDNFVIDNNNNVNESKTFTKKQVLEARKKYLAENSIIYSKKDIFNILKK